MAPFCDLMLHYLSESSVASSVCEREEEEGRDSEAEKKNEKILHGFAFLRLGSA